MDSFSHFINREAWPQGRHLTKVKRLTPSTSSPHAHIPLNWAASELDDFFRLNLDEITCRAANL